MFYLPKEHESLNIKASKPLKKPRYPLVRYISLIHFWGPSRTVLQCVCNWILTTSNGFLIGLKIKPENEPARNIFI